MIVAGETGSGKSTQLPQLCLELGWGTDGKLIGHTQPRRLAARTIAERVAEELGGTVGGVVGYTVRFTDRVGPDTRIKVMTDGILLAEIQRDPTLSRYDALIVDEAHERSLNVDFLLGYLKRLLPRRPDLKLVITSATIDTERFSRHFGAPVIEVTGRTYPVEMRYRPIQDETRDQTQAIADAVVELTAEGPGDILVFLSGEREIRDTADALRALDLRGTEIVPLYARLTAAEQHKVFAPHTGRRVVVTTNVAETSLTVPGIRYVVDPGTARISRYNRRTKVQRLPIEPISQASANQRAGRCGRVAPGICIRLYAEDDFLGRPAFTDPEILRTNLASVILQMAAIGLGDVAAFPFLDPPDSRAIKDGVTLLEELGAFDQAGPSGPGSGEQRRLTGLGRRLAQLPLDPRLGRMVLEAERHDCVHDVMVIAAALSIQDPRERPRDNRPAADAQHARFADETSDFLGYVNLWDHLRHEQKHLSSNQFRRRCKAEHLNFLRVREWQDVYSQLLHVARRQRVHVNRERAEPDRIHLSLLAGLLSNIGLWDDERRDYQGTRNARFVLAPGSALAKKRPRWVMAAELVETNRLWAGVAARIRPEWVEQVGAHLVKRTYTEPHWDRGRAAVIAFERVTLHGLPVVTGRRVNYARIDPALSRELFVHHALVEGDWDTHLPFVAHNRGVIDEVRSLEDRARRRDLLINDEELHELYDRRVGREVVSGRHFDRWWKRADETQRDLLHLTVDDLLDPGAAGIRPADFPDVWEHGVSVPLRYAFEPGDETDGVTAHVTLAQLARLDAARLDWQVPGMRAALVTALLRSLPKALRRNVSPAPDHARAFLERAGPADGPLLPVLSQELARMTGAAIPLASWQIDQVPDHLRVTYVVADDRGRPLAIGKDLSQVHRRIHAQMRAAVTGATHAVERRGLRTWNFGRLPSTVEVPWAGQHVLGYPALVDEGDSVAIRVLATPAEQDEAMWAGTRRLLLLNLPSTRKALRDRLTNQTKLALSHAPHAGFAELLDDCAAAAVDLLLRAHGGPVREEAAFDALRKAVQDELGDRAVGVVAVVGRILGAVHAVEQRLARISAPLLLPAVTDVHVQLSRLLFPGFASTTGAERLPDVLRYVRAIEARLDKLPADPHRDLARLHRLQQLDDALLAVPRRADVARIRWMLEELRVSFFAQQLGTAHRVSEERIRKEIDQARA